MALPVFLQLFKEFPKEAEIIGRLLAGYGELEFVMTSCLTNVLGSNSEVAFKTMYRARGEERRILVADAIMREPYSEIGLADAYCDAISSMQHCRVIRNQYAHCSWHRGENTGLLCFVDLEKATKKHRDLKVTKCPVSVELLHQQDDYFAYSNALFVFLFLEFRHRAGKESSPGIARPPKRPAPPLHNGEIEYWSPPSATDSPPPAQE